MKKMSAKFYILLLLLSTALAVTGDVFAQVPRPIESIQIDRKNQSVVSRFSEGNPDHDVVFELTSFLNLSPVILGTFPWKGGLANFLAINGYEITDTGLVAGGIEYTQINVRVQDSSGNSVGAPEESFRIVDIFKEDIDANRVDISWQDISLEQNVSDVWFYNIKGHDGTRSSNEMVYLNVLKTSTSSSKKEYITICAVLAHGKNFSLSYPNCYRESGVYKSQITESPFEAGATYKLYFSDTLNGSNVITSDNQKYYDLPDIPEKVSKTPVKKEVDPDKEEGTPDPVPNNDKNIFLGTNNAKILKNGIVPDCGSNISKGGGGVMCGFSHFILLVQNVIEYIFVLVLPIAALVFAYAGFLLLTSGGNPEKRKAAKNAMTSVLIGVVIVMAAWLIVKTVLKALGVDDDASWFYLSQ